MIRFGRYELLVLLAKGGLAEVWLARQPGPAGFEKLVVVKRLLQRLERDPDYVDMFLDEARINARLQHSNVLNIYELGEVEGRYFLAMEYVEGLPLGVLAQRAVHRLGDLPIGVAGALLTQAAAGLHYAHEARVDGAPLQIVHRDVSPLNLLVGWDGLLKIADFGIAKAEGRRTRTKSGVIKGTPTYMAPEQCTGGDIDRRADVFGLGILLWELLTGRRLFKRDSAEETYDAIVQGRVPPPSTYRPELSPAFDALTLRALARRPEDRFQTAAEMQQVLTSALRKEGLRAEIGDVRVFLEEHFPSERAEQEEMIARVRAGTVAPGEPLFSRAEHGLENSDEDALPPAQSAEEAPVEAPVETPPAEPAFTDGDTTRDERPSRPQSGVTKPPRRGRPAWQLILFALLAVAAAASIGLVAGRWSVR